MGRSSYTQSISTSTRTFQTKPAAPEVEKAKTPKPARQRPQFALPKVTVKLPADRRPWIAVAVLALISIFLFVQYREAQAKLHPSAAASTKQVLQTIDKVGKLVILPTDENPSVVTVSDPAKLSGQKFFAHAKAGDKVLIYNKAGEAILYRPSTNQIVTIAPVAGQ